MPEPIMVYVAGTPRPQPRPRFVGGRVISTASKAAKLYRKVVYDRCWLARLEGRPVKGAVSVKLDLWFATKDAGRHGRPHTSRPDADNVAKLWMDCAERAGLLAKGDAMVADLTVRKRWAGEAGAMMTVTPLGENLPPGQG